MAMTSICEKSICISQDSRNKGFMFTIKEVRDQVCSPENQCFNISSCKWLFTCGKALENLSELVLKRVLKLLVLAYYANISFVNIVNDFIIALK